MSEITTDYFHATGVRRTKVTALAAKLPGSGTKILLAG